MRIFRFFFAQGCEGFDKVSKVLIQKQYKRTKYASDYIDTGIFLYEKEGKKVDIYLQDYADDCEVTTNDEEMIKELHNMKPDSVSEVDKFPKWND